MKEIRLTSTYVLPVKGMATNRLEEHPKGALFISFSFHYHTFSWNACTLFLISWTAQAFCASFFFFLLWIEVCPAVYWNARVYNVRDLLVWRATKAPLEQNSEYVCFFLFISAFLAETARLAHVMLWQQNRAPAQAFLLLVLSAALIAHPQFRFS